MKFATIDLYSFNELDQKSKDKAIIEHGNFMEMNRQEWEQEDEFTPEYVEENIVLNEYLFFQDGTLAHSVQYTGNHPEAGKLELKLHGSTYLVQNS